MRRQNGRHCPTRIASKSLNVRKAECRRKPDSHRSRRKSCCQCGSRQKGGDRHRSGMKCGASNPRHPARSCCAQRCGPAQSWCASRSAGRLGQSSAAANEEAVAVISEWWRGPQGYNELLEDKRHWPAPTPTASASLWGLCVVVCVCAPAQKSEAAATMELPCSCRACCSSSTLYGCVRSHFIQHPPPDQARSRLHRLGPGLLPCHCHSVKSCGQAL